MDKQIKTPGQQLRQKYTRDKYIRQNHELDQYFDELTKMGIVCHKSIMYATFQLKNGLEYPGMAAKQKITKNQTLIKVPQKLILSAIYALGQPALQQIFSQTFYNYFNSLEDRVLLTYCLYILSIKAQDNIFYKMIMKMSRNIDIGFTWPADQIDIILDKNIKNSVQIKKKCFEQQWKQFLQIQSKYPILQKPQFNYANYLWIHIHICSRSFGKNLDYTSFVPFCQFINHHASTVYYTTNSTTALNQKVKQQQQLELSEDGSNDSSQFIQQGQFAFDQVQAQPIKWGENQCLDLNKVQKQKICQFTDKLLERVESQVDWKDFSILFVGHFIMRVNLIKNQYIQGRKNYQKTNKMFQSLTQVLDKYIALVKGFYKQKNGSTFQYKVTNRQNLQKQSQSTFVRPNAKQYKPQYTQFYLKTDKNDVFYPNTQVYFRYGRNSNRALLIHYGFTIQGNKYDSCWVSYQLNDNLKQMPDLMERVMKLGLSIRRKFTIRLCQLNMKLIIFFRLNSWNLYNVQSLNEIFYVMNIPNEIIILQQIINSFNGYLQMYTQCQQQQLLDKKLNYHKYFCKVYNLGKKRILERQIQIFQNLITVLQKLNQGQKMQQACEQLTQAQKYMCRHYLDSIVL